MPPTLQSPYTRLPNTTYRWLKGNLHAHSTRSDGTRDPQTVLDLYANLAHDFAVLSDHDVFSNYANLNPHHMTLLLANEVTAFGNHILQIGSSAIAPPNENRQQVIDAILATGGLAIINHPNWEANWNHCPFELMQKLKNYHGLEIFNGVCHDLEGSAYALDKWDRLLSEGRIVWGYANDDSHHKNQEGRGWNVVQVPADQAKNPAAILAALKAGNFYASTGVVIDSIDVTGTTLRITAKNAQEIELYGDKAVRLAVSHSGEITFDAEKANVTYLRAQLYGQGSARAWTQPFILKGGQAEGRRQLEEKFAALDAPRPTLTANRVPTIPPLASQDIESLWQKAPESLIAYNRKDGGTPPVKTAIRALVSGVHLALRIDCEEPAMDKLRIKTPADQGNGSLWAEECLEIFLDTEDSRQRYFHIIVNPVGDFHAKDPQDWSKNLKHQVHAHRGPAGWSIQLLFDLATLAPGLKIHPGSRFGFHLSRSRLTMSDPNKKHDGQVFMWSWVGSSNHTPSRFGHLQL